LIDYGVFYEFIPLEDVGKENPRICCLEEVELNKNYAMVISTSAGLWRYMIGDTVKFTKDHHSMIVAYYTELANDLEEDVISMVKGFNLINDQFTTEEVAKALFGRLPENSDEKIMIYNVLAIGIQEEVCNAYVNFLENLED
jgi:hypothetical protein